ncbi:hypothetical protein LRAMOSA02963 [Lichtheimia ramosa]|uniref:DUF4097 domain-containing protein n=1 Tax=Lichtheimia ramosa TaxID=688394 RepID=A0A077WUD9_9FUNG|nr:hypothetical protein LRAMOSA02963 [Lichtheimia ramosa]
MSKNYSQDLEAPLLGNNTTFMNEYRFQKYRRVAKASLWISVIALIFSFASFHRGVIIANNVPDSPAADMSTFEIEELSYHQCVDPSITDTYTFTVPVDEYHGLITDERLHNSISFDRGHVSVRVNPDIKDIIVRYEIQYQFEEDKDHVHIESRDSEHEQGVRHITFTVDDNDHHHRHHCLAWDLIIELPSEDALEKLSIGVANHNVGLYDAFVFDRLSISTANGNIKYHTHGVVTSSSSLSTANGNINVIGVTSTTKSSFSTANGNVHAQFDRLEGDHSSSTSSGNINFNAFAIGEESSEKDSTSTTTISLSSSAGSIDATVPNSFYSKFTANTVIGKAIVRSEEHPEKVHFKSQGRFSKNGYYGDSENDIQDGNRISASTSVGHAFITYA